MFPYLRIRRDFLDDCDRLINDQNGLEITDHMRDEINRFMRNRRRPNGNPIEVTDSDYESWAESMQKFREIMLNLSDDISISFEFMMPYRDNANDMNVDEERINRGVGYNKRIDVMVGGYSNEGIKTIIIVEMKRWEHGGINAEGNMYYYDRHAENGEDNPSLEVVEYCNQFASDNNRVIIQGNDEENRNIKLVPIVWLYNLNRDHLDEDVVQQLEERYRFNNENVRVFYQDQGDLVSSFFEDVFRRENDNVFSELKKGFHYIILHNSIQDILQGDADVRLCWDQQFCYNTIKEKIENINNYRGSRIYVRGRAGSGKSIVGIKLLKYCLDNNITCRYLIPEGAPVEAYNQNNQNESIQKLSRDVQAYNHIDVIIIDEGHSLYNEVNTAFNENGQNSLMIILYDPKQTVDDRCTIFDDLNDGERFELNSQFRCNGDDGYLKFVDDILDNIEETTTADILDFDVRIIRDGYTLRALKETNEYMILSGPSHSQSLQITIDDWNIERYNPYNGPFVNANCDQYSIYESVRGLEAEKIIVIIPDGNGDNDIQFTDGSIRAGDNIKNIYRVLLSRGLNSCYIYCEDNNLRDYLHYKKRIKWCM